MKLNHINKLFMLKLLVNKKLIKSNDTFIYWNDKLQAWFICSSFIDRNEEIWSYGLYTDGNNIIFSIIYHNLKMMNYGELYASCFTTKNDLKKYRKILSKKTDYRIKMITLTVIKKEHMVAVNHGRNIVDVEMLTK